MSFRVLAAATVAATLGLGFAAQAATTFSVGGAAGTSGVPSYREVAFDFVLPSGFTDATLTVTSLAADDRGILRLNGVTIDSAGIDIGIGLNGGFDFNDGAGTVPFTFAGFNGARNTVVASGFVAGNNTLRLLINDTNAGVGGTLLNGPGGPSSTTGYSFSGEVSFEPARAGPAIPEPATWAMMILGFFGAGCAVRRRNEPARAHRVALN